MTNNVSKQTCGGVSVKGATLRFLGAMARRESKGIAKGVWGTPSGALPASGASHASRFGGEPAALVPHITHAKNRHTRHSENRHIRHAKK